MVSVNKTYADEHYSFQYPDNFTVEAKGKTGEPIYEFSVKRMAFMDNQASSALRKGTNCYLHIEKVPDGNIDHDKLLWRFMSSTIGKVYEVAPKLKLEEVPPEMLKTVHGRISGVFDAKLKTSVYKGGILISQKTTTQEMQTFAQVSDVADASGDKKLAILDCYFQDRYENLVRALADRLSDSVAAK